jgi:branched-chain amino acid transport system ATP-binding protein
MSLVLENVDVRFGGVHAVHGLSLAVERGEIVGLVGPNGAGKSSTLHAIMGLAPATGSVRLGDRELLGRSPEDVARSGVALVPEGRRIFAELTVEENLRLGLAARRRRNGGFDSVYELFPIVKDFRSRQAGALSGGQQQQLAIARALVSDPDVLLLDEPVSRRASSTSSSRRWPRSASAGSPCCSSSSAPSERSPLPTARTCSRTASSASRSARRMRATPTS